MHTKLKDIFCEIGNFLCNHLYSNLQSQTFDQLSAVYALRPEDTIYQIDRNAELIIMPLLEKHAASVGGIVLIAEGISDENAPIVLPKGMTERQAKWRVIIDPIDGTKVLMYGKRSAFFLAGIAPNLGKDTSLQDIEVAVMTELPTAKALYSDTFWAIRGGGVGGFATNLITQEKKLKSPAPSQATTIKGGFAQLTRFYAPARDLVAKIEDELLEILFPNLADEQAATFEDQYIASSGQLYELLVGHDRFVADLRPLVYRWLAKQGKRIGHTAHPYDLCTMLIAKEAGIIITDELGGELDAKMHTTIPVGWVGYANERIRQEVEKTLQMLLKKYGLQL
ncbi:MAG: hypothetical protein EAZ08_04765 [Cytophagales bacterium]|nr:MAG: hypothetical protein EAZ08_04765 [Cytophagales bacterium]